MGLSIQSYNIYFMYLTMRAFPPQFSQQFEYSLLQFSQNQKGKRIFLFLGHFLQGRVPLLIFFFLNITKKI